MTTEELEEAVGRILEDAAKAGEHADSKESLALALAACQSELMALFEGMQKEIDELRGIIMGDLL